VRKAQWELTRRRSNVDVYGVEKNDLNGRTYVDGRSLVQDLVRVHALTRDPVFDLARRAVEAYGFHLGTHTKPVKRLKQYLGFVDSELFEALERMHRLRQPGNKTLLRGEFSDAAEQVVAKMGFPANSFEDGVKIVRKAYAQWRKAPDAPICSEELGNLGDFLIVSPVPDKWYEPAHGAPVAANTRVPNNRYWRLMAALGAVTTSAG
jgi:hypothetical protein